MHPDLGYWNTRQWAYWKSGDACHKGGRDYFHSHFIDLLMTGLLGIRVVEAPPHAEHRMLEVSPLLPPSLLARTPFFAIDGVRVGDSDVAVVWDADGKRYGKGKGLSVLVGGVVVASRGDIGRLAANLSGSV